MKTIMALVLKFISTFGAACFVFGVINKNPLNWILVVAITVTIVNYVLGDLVILQSKGNVIASLSYGVLGAVSAYLIDLFPVDFKTNIAGLIVFAVIVMLIEYLYRIFLIKNEKVSTKDFHIEPPIE